MTAAGAILAIPGHQHASVGFIGFVGGPVHHEHVVAVSDPIEATARLAAWGRRLRWSENPELVRAFMATRGPDGEHRVSTWRLAAAAGVGWHRAEQWLAAAVRAGVLGDLGLTPEPYRARGMRSPKRRFVVVAADSRGAAAA